MKTKTRLIALISAGLLIFGSAAVITAAARSSHSAASVVCTAHQAQTLNGTGKCLVDKCSCGSYDSSGPSFGYCGRSGCGHARTKHK